MNSDTCEVSLDEITEFQNGFAFKSSDYVEPSAGTEEVLRMGYIMRGGGYKEDETPVFIPEKYPKDLSRYRLERGDIVMAMTDMKNNVAILGNTARIPESGRFVLNQRVGRIRVLDSDAVDPLYLYYYTNSPVFIEDIRSRANSGVQVNLSTAAIKASRVRLPPICEQRSIGESLHALDEKIANNRALATDLEAMARAIFKSWFVDFDPVKAKMEGRTPTGMDADTAALFPDELVESELGLIPCGWEAATLANHAALNPESWSARNHPETVQYADLAGTDRGQIVETKTFVWEDAPSRARRVLRLGDTIIGTVRPGNRAYSFVGVDGLTGSTGFAVLRPNNSSQRSLVYLAATSDDAINRLVNLADGAAYPAVRPDVVAATPIVTPPDAVIEEFAKITQPLLDWVVAAHAENTELAQLRDILLPRLISGKLRLPGVFNDTEPTLSEEHTNV